MGNRARVVGLGVALGVAMLVDGCGPRCSGGEVEIQGGCAVACNRDRDCQESQHCEGGACLPGAAVGGSSGMVGVGSSTATGASSGAGSSGSGSGGASGSGGSTFSNGGNGSSTAGSSVGSSGPGTSSAGATSTAGSSVGATTSTSGAGSSSVATESSSAGATSSPASSTGGSSGMPAVSSSAGSSSAPVLSSSTAGSSSSAAVVSSSAAASSGTSGSSGPCVGARSLFVTTGRVPGDFGGPTGADVVCMGEATTRGLAGSFKALLFSPGARAPEGPGSAPIDWVLQPATTYCREGTPVGTTTMGGVFTFPLQQPLGSGMGTWWSGLATNWTAQPDANCNGWTSNNLVDCGAVGSQTATGPTALQTSIYDCNQMSRLLCVEQ